MLRMRHFLTAGMNACGPEQSIGMAIWHPTQIWEHYFMPSVALTAMEHILLAVDVSTEMMFS